jgi:hypothetical protein
VIITVSDVDVHIRLGPPVSAVTVRDVAEQTGDLPKYLRIEGR